MFSGIIENTGEVARFEGSRLLVKVPWKADGLHIGQSLSVDGACLTVVRIQENAVEFDVSPETQERTTLSPSRTGKNVNLERGLQVGDRLDGHFVTGHVDTVGTIQAIDALGKDGMKSWTIEVPSAQSSRLAQKGSVAINGVSLTVNEVTPTTFTVALIPHTLQVTNLGEYRVGDRINVEFDLVAKYVERFVQNRTPGSMGTPS